MLKATLSICHLPAVELCLAEAHLEAFLSGGGGLLAPGVPLESVVLHPVDAPGPFARFHPEAVLLGVDREDGELRLGQGSWKSNKFSINWRIANSNRLPVIKLQDILIGETLLPIGGQ